jgi:hypothetical protein
VLWRSDIAFSGWIDGLLVGLRVVVRIWVVVPRSVSDSEPVVCEKQQGDDRQTDERLKEPPRKDQWLPLEKDITT